MDLKFAIFFIGVLLRILALQTEASNDAVAIANVSTTSVPQNQQCKQWFYYDSTTEKCECLNNIISVISCEKNEAFLEFGYCASYNEYSRMLYIARCMFFQPDSRNLSQYGILLPKNVSQINEYSCAPMNRRGFVCSECIEGYGLSVTSYQSTCTECKNNWEGVLWYLLVELLPLTAFYLLLLIFRVDIISAPMMCFIMYSMLVNFIITTTTSSHSINEILFTEHRTPRLGTKLLRTVSGIWNLDFMLDFIPPFCISSKLTPFHLASLSWICTLYPFILMLFTYVIIELHGRNFWPVVWIWNVFHKSCFRLRKVWNIKNDMVNVFSSFFLIIFGKVITHALRISECHCLSTVSESGVEEKICPTLLDPNIDCQSPRHLSFIVPSILTVIIFNVLPMSLLVLYPIKVVRTLLSKCRLDTIALNIFVEKFHHSYKNGLDGGRDMRSFCGLYFILTCLIATCRPLSRYLIETNYFFSKAVLFWTAALLVALVKPYKSRYMNVLDSLLLAHLGLICILLPTSVGVASDRQPKLIHIVFPQLMLVLPFVGLIMYIAARVANMTYNLGHTFYDWVKQTKFRGTLRNEVDHLSEEERLISSHESVTIDYGTQP